MVFHDGLEILREQLGVIIGKASGFVRQKPLTVGAAALGAGVLIPALGVGVSRVRKRKKKRVARARKKRVAPRGGRKVHRVKHLHRVSASGRKKRHKTGRAHHTRRGSKQIHFTKNRQPYIILSSGKARFIKRSSVRRRRKLKGGTF